MNREGGKKGIKILILLLVFIIPIAVAFFILQFILRRLQHFIVHHRIIYIARSVFF